ncbi:nuclear transport factor 2 family protein [Brevundimonas sp.]|uniref:nuclear transport factor 2 family protein n=1 Tax=Brevundimonas sp. TaxID=1871086 RepID=UPI002FC64C3F
MSVSPQKMIETVEAYVAAFETGDAEMAARLYAADAVVRDPVDAKPVIGHEAILAFYQASMKTGAKLSLHGPVRTASSIAAFAFSVHLTLPKGPCRIDVIDTFEFNPDGLIQQMTAYWGPNNMHGSQE